MNLRLLVMNEQRRLRKQYCEIGKQLKAVELVQRILADVRKRPLDETLTPAFKPKRRRWSHAARRAASLRARRMWARRKRRG